MAPNPRCPQIAILCRWIAVENGRPRRHLVEQVEVGAPKAIPTQVAVWGCDLLNQATGRQLSKAMRVSCG